MAIVVCRSCGCVVRSIPPPKSNRKVMGLCKVHFRAFQEEVRFETEVTSYMSDVLETCLKSFQQRRWPGKQPGNAS